MKKFASALLIVLVSFLHSCEPKDPIDVTGLIYGTITDKATAEPVKAASVELIPGGIKAITGSEGRYEFPDVEVGDYHIIVNKTGYEEYMSSPIVVASGQRVKVDVPLEMLPPALRVVDDENRDLSLLDFGDAEADVARSFNIYNDGPESLEWEVTKTANWIDSLSRHSGKLNPNAKHSVVVFINREKLVEGVNKTTLQVTSTNGSKAIEVQAVNSRETMVVNMLDCSDVTGTSAVLNAEMSNFGNPRCTERGFVYSEKTNPDLESTIYKLTVPMTDEATFSTALGDLDPEKTYYIRAYAINAISTVYSTNEIKLTLNPALPEITTDAVSEVSIAKGTAFFNATIKNVGDPAYTERGFVYATTPSPTIYNEKVLVSGTGVGKYSAKVEGLEEGKIYYIRAFASNVKGTAYGEQVTLDYNAAMPVVSTLEAKDKDIAQGTATFSGKIDALGDLGYTERGFVYSATHEPTIEDSRVIAEGTGAGLFSAQATGLAEGYTYRIRAYATNAKGTVYGKEITMDYNATLASVSTLEVQNKNIAQGTATYNAIVKTKGDPIFTEKGFVYATTQHPTIDDEKIVVAGSEIGKYSAQATGLAEGKTYYIRAYITNMKGTSYGEEITMDYTASMPVVSTIEVLSKNIGAGTASFSGKVTALGDLGYTEHGFVYSATHEPTIEDARAIAEGSGTGLFSAQATGLAEGYTYRIRAYATNAKGTVYGQEITMDYFAVAPAVTTQSVAFTSNVKTARFVAQINSVGDPVYSERGFVYGKMQTPTIDDATASVVVVPNTSSTQYEQEVTREDWGNEIWYVRAYLKHAKGVVYGEVKSMQNPEYIAYQKFPTFEYGGSTYRVYPDMGMMAWDQAVNACNNLVYAGYSDWYLPSIQELNAMYLNKDKIGGFATDDAYWSSTEYDASECWGQYFDTGDMGVGLKNYIFRVRPIRKEK